MVLINNPWGESNEAGLKRALDKRGMTSAGGERVQDSDLDVLPQLTRLRNAGADSLILVANVGPSAQVVKSLDRMGWDVPIVSHWGPAGGRFGELAGPDAERVHFVQTYLFTEDSGEKGSALLAALKARYPEIKSLADVTPATGIANAYDAMYLTALAIEKTGSTKGNEVRDGFYAIEQYDGLIKQYQQPFGPEKNDALGPNDYIIGHFVGDEIVPVRP